MAEVPERGHTLDALKVLLKRGRCSPIGQLMKWYLTLEFGEIRLRIWPFGLVSVLIAELGVRGVYEK